MELLYESRGTELRRSIYDVDSLFFALEEAYQDMNSKLNVSQRILARDYSTPY